MANDQRIVAANGALSGNDRILAARGAVQSIVQNIRLDFPSKLGVNLSKWTLNGNRASHEAKKHEVTLRKNARDLTNIPAAATYEVLLENRRYRLIASSYGFKEICANPPIGLRALAPVYAPSARLIQYRRKVVVGLVERIVEIWSPNACRDKEREGWTFLPLCPGPRPPSLDSRKTLPREASFADGSHGIYDASTVPQMFEAGRPWLAFHIRPHLLDARGLGYPLQFPENLSLAYGIEASRRQASQCVVGEPLYVILAERLVTLNATMSRLVKEKPRLLENYRYTMPKALSSYKLEGLKTPHEFMDLVTDYAVEMRHFKEVAAFCRFGEVYPAQGVAQWIQTLSEDDLSKPSPFADPQLLGCWAKDASGNGCYSWCMHESPAISWGWRTKSRKETTRTISPCSKSWD